MMTAHFTTKRPGGNRGFTLVEMLIVAALISIFSALAVFNITTQLNLNKQKAAVAECRQLATALTFANDDLGFLPKLCFLRYNLPNLQSALLGTPTTANTMVEAYGNQVGDLGTRLTRQWKGSYMSFNSDKVVKMQFNAHGANREFEWPADPWGNPYAVYLIYSDPKETNQLNREKFIDAAGKTADFSACVASYGRNRVPGLGDLPTGQESARADLRVYRDDQSDPRKFFLLNAAELNDAKRSQRIDMIRLGPPLVTPVDPNLPRMREPLCDDRVYEF